MANTKTKDISINVTADEIRKRRKNSNRIRIIIIIILLLLMSLFVVLSLVYNGGSFTVTLDPNYHTKAGIALYTDEVKREHVRRLYAEDLDFMDNISIDWLPTNYNDFQGGSHNGDNYLAYTFYVENQGTEVQSYWYTLYIEDVIKNIDEALRIMIVLNDEVKVYAKANPLTGKPEKIYHNKPNNEENQCEIFYKNSQPVLENRKDFKPGDIDKLTVFIWIEGDDPECVDNLLGGEIKLSMKITEEHIEKNDVLDENKKKNEDGEIYHAIDEE